MYDTVRGFFHHLDGVEIFGRVFVTRSGRVVDTDFTPFVEKESDSTKPSTQDKHDNSYFSGVHVKSMDLSTICKMKYAQYE